MTKLIVICGHGAGDPGACGNGFEEAERVRVLGKRIKELGGNNVILEDIKRNFYKDNGISHLTHPKDYQIIELHMDSASASARGAHVIIDAGMTEDKYDKALADFLTGLLPGRSQSIVKRNNLANPARALAAGYGYRLVEVGFISNAEDVAIFNANIDTIAKGILACFDNPANAVAPQPTPAPTQSLDDVAQAVMRGEYGNGSARVAALTSAGYDADAVQARVNELLGASSQPAPKPSVSITEIAQAVLRGEYGNGNDRRQALANAGYDYDTVQAEVNRLAGVTPAPQQPTVSLDDVARAVIRGDYGNGADRRQALANAGYDYDAVQARVNQLLG